MSVELRPLGVPCNIRCQYCYQNPQRDTAVPGPPYDLEAMKVAIEAEGGPFGLFGGEPLLVPEADLENLWSWGLERFGENGIQTNGTLITEHHVQLFIKYRVRVGISVDGPGALNDARWAGTLEKTRDATDKTLAAISLMCAAGIAPTLIITLHRGNASAGRLELLGTWLRSVVELGIKQVRLHLLEVEDEEIRSKYAMSDAENFAALRSLQSVSGCVVDVYQDVDRMLLARDESSACVWRACDPYTTAGVRGVEGQGQRSNCGRTNKDGIEFEKASEAGYERYLALYQTPESSGGCQGCRFFLMCKGQCPGTALDGDWRNRSEHCEVYRSLFREREAEAVGRGEVPLSLSPERQRIEQAMLAEWSLGNNPNLASVAAGVSRGVSYGSSRAPARRPVRSSWVSERARKTWEPRMQRIRAALEQISWRSVMSQIRPCAIEAISPQKLGGRESELATSGCVLRILDDRSELGENLVHQVAMGREAEVFALRAAWNSGDVATVGRLLGYPECCVGSFVRQEIPSAIPALPTSPLTSCLWRPLGIRALLHHPCTPSCEGSLAFAERLLAHGQTLGFATELDWLLQILCWPVEWSCLHSIAEVRTPILKYTYWVESSAQIREQRFEVRYPGSQFPAEGAQGLRFPFQRPAHLKLSESHGHQAGLANPIGKVAFDVSLASLIRNVPR